MATIEDFKRWFERDLARAGPSCIEFISHSHGSFEHEMRGPNEPTVSKRQLRICIYTEVNSYHFSVVERPSGRNYLGCIAKSRKPRAGEDWTRGNDLPDGPLDQDTWRRILAGIVSYEMVQVHHNVMTRDWTGEVPEPDKSIADVGPSIGE